MSIEPIAALSRALWRNQLDRWLDAEDRNKSQQHTATRLENQGSTAKAPYPADWPRVFPGI